MFRKLLAHDIIILFKRHRPIFNVDRNLNATLKGLNSVVDAVDHLKNIYTAEQLANCDNLAKKNSEGTWDYF